MRTKSSNRYDKLKEQALSKEEGAEPTRPVRRPSVLGKRQEAVAAVASGKVRSVKVFGHDPARIRAWAGHNRDYAALSEARCSDLIEGFRRADQQFPAIVRTVTDSEQYDFEFICGARRHWTATYLKRDLIVEVRNLEDRDAFLLQDIENRDREDISDYERACDYAKALPVYFSGKKSHMAEQLQIDNGNFNRLLALVDLPNDIVQAYDDIRELVVHHGAFYAKYLKDPATKKRMVAAARKLKGQGASGKLVMAALRQAALGKAVPGRTKADHARRTGVLTHKVVKAGEHRLSFKLSTVNRQQQLAAIKRDFLAVIETLEQEAEPSRPKSAVEAASG